MRHTMSVELISDPGEVFQFYVGASDLNHEADWTWVDGSTVRFYYI